MKTKERETMNRAREKAQAEAKIRTWIALGLGLALIAVVVAAGILVGGGSSSQEPVGTSTPAHLTSDGSFRVLSDGSVDTEADESAKDGRVRVQLFFDPMCPGCGAFEQAAGDYLLSLVQAERIDLYLVPVSFLDGTSTNYYSTRAVNAVATVGSESPEHFYAFVQALFSPDFQPSEGINYKPVTDEDLGALAESVGVPADVADSFAEGNYGNWVGTHSQATMERTDLFPDRFSTPGLFIGGQIDPETSQVSGATQVMFTNSATILEDMKTVLEQVESGN